MDRDKVCGTCEGSYVECPGHFGHIPLDLPVYHPGYITHIMKVLKCICGRCGRLRLRKKEERDKISAKASARVRFKRVLEACSKIRHCANDEDNAEDGDLGCGHVQPDYRKEGLTITRDYSNRRQAGTAAGVDTRDKLTPADVRKLFRMIRDDDIRLLGMDPHRARPEWMIITNLAVAPPPVRPSVDAGDGTRGQLDDLTYAYAQVVRTNEELRRCRSTG